MRRPAVYVSPATPAPKDHTSCHFAACANAPTRGRGTRTGHLFGGIGDQFVQHHCHWLLPPWQAQFQGFRYTWCASHRRDARRCKAYDEHARCRHDDAQRSVISPHCLLQDLLVQRQSRDRLAQPSILGLKVLQPLHVVRLQAAVLASGSTSPPPARLSGSYGLSPFLGSQNINLPQRRNDPFRLFASSPLQSSSVA
jgi:hypothetical protein